MIHQALQNLKQQMMAKNDSLDFDFAQNARRKAKQWIEQHPLPHRKTPGFKEFPFHRVFHEQSIHHEQPIKYPPTNIRPFSFDAYHIVCINGQYIPLPNQTFEDGVNILPISQTTQPELLAHPKDIFMAMNTMYMNQGFSIEVDEEVVLSKPLHIIHFLDAEQKIIFPRVQIHLHRGAEAVVLETFVSNQSKTQNISIPLHEQTLAPYSSLCHIQLFQDRGQNHYLPYIKSEVLNNAHYNLHEIGLFAQTIRNDIDIELLGEHASTFVNTLDMANDTDYRQQQIYITHKSKQTHSKQIIHGIALDQGQLQYNGDIHIQNTAAKSIAEQECRHIPLSEKAIIGARPDLRIDIDDVQCAHGVTTGRPDPKHVFYLQSRGLTESLAKTLLIESFIQETVQALPKTKVREYLANIISMHIASLKI